jgi:3-phenylpropionate/trans-cinnamate dioxygenase ferredoxin reductase subunit
MTMAAQLPLVIVGASYAGTQLAASARELGFEGPIVMVGDERHVPYQRPPLSKGLLTGKTPVDRLELRGPDFFAHNGIDLRLGLRATALDARERTVTFDDGTVQPYGWLALATGARCRPLPVPGTELEGVFNLRTLDDALGVAGALVRSKRACVIGGGFIGLEVASALNSRGADVTVIESQPRLLARVFPAPMSEYVAAAHQRRGVSLVTGRGVRQLHGKQGRIDAVELDDGTHIECDMAVLGTGVLPNTGLAEQAGIATGNGILVDASGRTSVPRVLAAGDVANMAMPAVPGGRPVHMRLESIQAANDGARAAAAVLVDREQPFTGVPWFWSDQFELKFQMAGLPASGDATVLRGDTSTDRFTLFYLRDGAVVAAHSVNRPAEHMQSRRLIASAARVTPQVLADESVDLKSLVATA